MEQSAADKDIGNEQQAYAADIEHASCSVCRIKRDGRKDRIRAYGQAGRTVKDRQQAYSGKDGKGNTEGK